MWVARLRPDRAMRCLPYLLVAAMALFVLFPLAGPGQAHGPELQVASPPVSSPLIIADPTLDDLYPLAEEILNSPSGRAVYLILHQEHLNQQIALLEAEEPDMPYHDIAVSFLPGEVRVAGQTDVLGLSIGVELRAY